MLAVATSLVFLTSFVRRTEIARQRLIIGAELREHFFRGNKLIIVVLQPLMPRDIADRVQRCSSIFARTHSRVLHELRPRFAGALVTLLGCRSFPPATSSMRHVKFQLNSLTYLRIPRLGDYAVGNRSIRAT